MIEAAHCAVTGSWGDYGAWCRALLVSLSTVVLNTWLAHKVVQRAKRPIEDCHRR